MAIDNWQGKATSHQIVRLILRAIQEKPFAGRSVIYLGATGAHGWPSAIRINTYRINLNSSLISKRILHPLRFIRHNGADTAASRKEEIYNGTLSLHFVTTYDSTI